MAGLLLAALAMPVPAAGPETSSPPPAPPAVGDPFRTFPATDLDGRPFDLAALLKEKVGLVSFWASWCKPCIEEIPRLRDLSKRYRRSGLVVVGIGVQEGGETIPKQRATAAREMMFYQLLFDKDRQFQTGYAVRALPVNVLVGADGKILWHDATLPEDLESRIQTLLGEAGRG